MNLKLSNVSNTEAKAWDLAEEDGKGTVLAMLLCIGAITAYLKVGRLWLDANIPHFYGNIILLMLAVVTLFTLGCALHMIFIGDKSGRELRKDLKRQTSELYEFVRASEERIEELESNTVHYAGVIRPSGITSLSTARRIVSAIARRADEVNKLVASKNKYNLIDAHDLLNRPLRVGENAMDSLIGADPIPPLDPEVWFQTVDELCEKTGQEIERVAEAA